MRLSNIARLYRVRLRARLTQELFALLGIAIGVSLLFASQVANTSLDSSVQRLTNGIVGQMRFQLAARDSHGFDEGLLRRVSALPGVQTAAPVLEVSANIVGPSGEQSVQLVGTDPRLARLAGGLARHVRTPPLGTAKVFTLAAPLAEKIGVTSIQPVALQIGARRTSALLVPQLLVEGAAALGQSPLALAPLRAVQRLTGLTGRLTSVYVRPRPHMDDRVKAGLLGLAAGRLNVRPASFTTALFRRAAGPVSQSTGLFSAISALVGFLFAFNALLLTVPQRRNLIEDLRLDGYTRRMILEVLFVDALVLGLLASIAGLLLGELLSVALFSSSPGYLSFAFPIGAQRIVSWQSVALAVFGGMLAAGVGVLVPLRREIVARPVAGIKAWLPLAGARVWLSAGASVCLAGTTIILLAAPQLTIVGVVGLTVALLLSLPTLLELSIRLADRMQRLLTSAASYLALIELRARSNRARSLAIAATGAIAVFGSVAIQGARGSLERGLDASARGIDSGADIWVTPAGMSNSFATTSFQGGDDAALARLPGVRSVQIYRGSFLDWGDRRIWVLAPPQADAHPVAAGQIVSGNANAATVRLRSSGWVVLSRAIASEHDLHVGQAFTLPAARPTVVRVAALSTNLGWPPGAIVLNAEDYAHAWASEDPSAYQVELAPGASPDRVSHDVRKAIGPHSGLHVETRSARERRHFAQAAQSLSRLTQIRSLVLIAAVLAMAAAMGAMIWQRRLRLADMKVDGFSKSVLWRALLWESALLLSSGCSLGAVFGLYGQLVLSRALSAVYGFPVVESIPVLAAVESFALITLVAVAIVSVPGYVAARVRPTVGLRD
jgi:putative ABC transport system permease protein